MESEKLPLGQALFGLIFALIFLAVGAYAVSASYDNDGGSHGGGSETVPEGEDHDSDTGTEVEHVEGDGSEGGEEEHSG